MSKIPVGRTIAAAYGFLFSQIGTVLAVAGGPAVLYAGADYASRAFLASQRAAPPSDATEGIMALATLSASIAGLFAMSVAAMGVTQAAIRGGDPKPADYFPLGRATWRMFGANLRFLLGALVLIALAAAVTAVAFKLAGVPLDAPDKAEPSLATIAAGLIAWAAVLYVLMSLLRMGFLLPAVVASEEKGGLKRSHDLSEGNVWRLVAIVLALVLPLLVLLLTAASAVLSTALGPDFAGGEVTPEILQRVEDAIAAQLLPWEIFNAVIFVLYAGLMYGGSAFAYRAATGPRSAED